MNRLGEDNRLPVINIREGDIGVLLGLPIGGLFLGSLAGSDWLSIGLLLCGFTIAVAVSCGGAAYTTATAIVKPPNSRAIESQSLPIRLPRNSPPIGSPNRTPISPSRILTTGRRLSSPRRFITRRCAGPCFRSILRFYVS